MTLLVAFVIVMGAVLVAVFFNRDSEQVVNAAVPVAFGAAAALWLVFAFNRPEPITRTFPVAFYVDAASNLPIVVPHRPVPGMTLALADMARHTNPAAFDESDRGILGFMVYHEYLQKVLVDQIASGHPRTWRMEPAEQFETGSGRMEQSRPRADASSRKSLVLSAADVRRKMEPNRFASAHTLFGSMALPPGTSFTVRAPQGADITGEIRLYNRLCDISIETTGTLYGTGLGSYHLLAGMTQQDAQAKYWHQDFVVRARASFTPYLMGHPDMQAHREWATGIIDIIGRLDETAIWRGARESFTFWQQLPAEQKWPSTIGPVLWSNPPRPASADEQAPARTQ